MGGIGAALLCLAAGGGTTAGGSGLQLGHVVGDYWTGPGISGLLSLTIHENGRFCYDLGSDIGVLEEGCGDVLAEGRRLSFVVADAKPNLMSREPWQVVGWGQRLYLIPESGLLEFANWVNWGFEPRAEESGSFLFRRGDSQRPTAGMPPLPERWTPFLLRAPVRGTVVRVLDGDEGQIDIGGDQGLREGMRLWVASKPGKAFMVELTGVQGRLSSVRIELAGDGPLAIGQEVKSRP